MNSLYGRFTIHPKSVTTEVCDEARYKHLIRDSELIFGDMFSENYYIVPYHSNTGVGSETGLDYWNLPKNSAVQLPAAITASARIYIYFISQERTATTRRQTQLVVLGQPLPEEVISSSLLAKFKLEDRIMKGDFLAPKCYYYIAIDETNVLKYKDLRENQVYPEWFESQYAHSSRTKKETDTGGSQLLD